MKPHFVLSLPESIASIPETTLDEVAGGIDWGRVQSASELGSNIGGYLGWYGGAAPGAFLGTLAGAELGPVGMIGGAAFGTVAGAAAGMGLGSVIGGDIGYYGNLAYQGAESLFSGRDDTAATIPLSDGPMIDSPPMFDFGY